jgi:hypothetical protein
MRRVIVFDLVKRQPACVLLQVAYGGSPGIAQMFPVEAWLLAPTPDMRAYEIPEDELERVVKAFGGLYTSPPKEE